MNELKLFERTKHSEWYISPNGSVFMRTKYQGRDNTLKEKTPTLNKRRCYIYVRTPSGNHLLHRLVAVNFIPNPENKPCVNHKNGIKTDNSLNNLEWVTYSENSKHAYDNNFTTIHRGSSHCNSKLTEEQVIEIRKSYVKGGNISHREIAKKHNVTRELIRDIINYKKWKHI